MRAARSLLVFVGVGIVSGLAFGLYLLDARNSMHAGVLDVPARQVDGPAISIVPSKMSFGIGEQVTFRIVNTGTVPLHSEDGMFGSAITGLSGIPIYTFDIQDRSAVHGADSAGADYMQDSGHLLQAQEEGEGDEQDEGRYGASLMILLPGDEIAISWDQTRYDGESVQAGLYKASTRADVISEAMASAIAAAAASVASATAATTTTSAAAASTAGAAAGVGPQGVPAHDLDTDKPPAGDAPTWETIDSSVTITVQ